MYAYMQDQLDRDQFELSAIDVGGLSGTLMIDEDSDNTIVFEITMKGSSLYNEIVYTNHHESVACQPKYLHHLIGKTFDSCRMSNCDEVRCSFSDLCEMDYIYNYTRDENCCVCMENGGCWTRLSCKHYIHSSCWQKICIVAFEKARSFASCPICRNKNKSETTVYMCTFIENDSH